MDTKSRNDLLEMYRIIAKTYGSAEAEILADAPEWKGELGQLEDAFTAAFQRGSDCQAEFSALREHWRNGIKLTRKARAQDGGNSQ